MNIEAVVDFLQSGLGEVDTLLPDAGILRVACLKIDEFPAGRFCGGRIGLGLGADLAVAADEFTDGVSLEGPFIE